LSFCNPLPARAYSESDLSSVLLLLRAQEATAQELNLLTSGKYKNLQRANVKLAVRFILTNYALSTNFAKLSGTDSKLASLGSDVVFSLNTILEYFDDRNTDSIKVRPPPITSTPLNKLRPDEFPMPENPDLDSGKKKIVLAGLAKAKGLFDEYFEALPDRELVADARRRVREENEANKAEYDEFVKTDYLNVVVK